MKFCHDDRALMSANQSMGREKKEKSVSDRNLSASARKYQKVTKFASPHKSPNHMWYKLQKVWLETRRICHKEREIGTILHMLWLQGKVIFFFFYKGRGGASFVFVTLSVNSWEDSLSRAVCAACILQRARSIGCWIHGTKDLEPLQQEQAIKRTQQIRKAQFKSNIENIFFFCKRNLKIFFCCSP